MVGVAAVTTGRGEVALTSGLRVPDPGRLGNTSLGAAAVAGVSAAGAGDPDGDPDASLPLKPAGSRLLDRSLTCTLPSSASRPVFSVELGAELASVLNLNPGGRKALMSSS